MVEKMAYPMLSSSPLMISVENMLIFGYNKVALKWQEEDWIFKDPLSNVMNHASPNLSIQDEWHIITIWHPNQKNVEGCVQVWMIPMVSQVDTTQSSQLLFENITWQVVSQRITSCACLLIYYVVVINNIYQLIPIKTIIHFPKVM